MCLGNTSIQNLDILSTCLTYNLRTIVVDEKPAEKTILLKNNVQAKWQITWRDTEIAPLSDTFQLCITKETIVSTSRVFVCPSTRAPFHWFNRYAYLKLDISASCQ